MSEPGSDGSDFDDEDAPPPPPKRKDNNAKPQPQDSKSAAVSKEVAQQLQSLSFGLNVSKNKKDIAANVDEFSQSSVDESKDETIDNSFESSSVEVEGDDDSEPESDPSSEEEEDGDDDKASSMNTSAGGYNVSGFILIQISKSSNLQIFEQLFPPKHDSHSTFFLLHYNLLKTY